jgi:putative spermidine/putrescine transport system substrate-binding protein
VHETPPARAPRRGRIIALSASGLALVVAAVFTIRAVVAEPNSGSADQGAAVSATAATKATSMADFGGLEGLIAAAKGEGELNVIALPPEWANYGAIIKAFSDKYGIKANELQPDASSQDEINTAVQLAGKSTAPDVFDMGQSVALANTHMFAPYKVATFDDISDAYKDPDGLWVNDYGGYMSIGYDSAKVPVIRSVDDLLKPEFKDTVAINGDPTQAGAAFMGVMMVAVAQGGSPDDIAPGVEFFRKLHEVGNFLPDDPTPATIESRQTPVVVDWDYLNVAETRKLPTWRVLIPPNAAVAGFYFQAINRDAPHPAAARLWQEFLFSDEGQNLFLKGGVRPVRTGTLLLNGTIDRNAYGFLPPVDGAATYVTAEQNARATKYLDDNWAAAVG